MKIFGLFLFILGQMLFKNIDKNWKIILTL